VTNRQFRFRVLVACQVILFTMVGATLLQEESDSRVLVLIAIVLVSFEGLSLTGYNTILNDPRLSNGR